MHVNCAVQAASVQTDVETRQENRSWLLFAAVVTVVMLAGTGFIVATWNHFTAAKPSFVELIFPGMTLAFIASTMLAARSSNTLVRLTYHATAIWLGFTNFALFASIFAWLALGFARAFSAPVPRETIAFVALSAVILATLWSLFRAWHLNVTVIKVRLTPALPASWRGRSAALVTDLHLGNILRAPFLRRIVSKLEAVRPDIVFISGDLFDDTETDFDALLAPWKKLSPPLGAFYVTGNHEEFTQREKFFGPVARAGIRVLNNEKVDVDGVQVIGLHDTEATHRELFRSIMDRLEVDRGRASILLAHQPMAAKTAHHYGVSLQLSGHTHGGQFWPWTLVARRVHGAANYGLNRLGEMLLYTSSGAGTWGPPMRFGTKSEIVVLKFE
jgi:predicted MPP superfamily phosphohydrolase